MPDKVRRKEKEGNSKNCASDVRGVMKSSLMARDNVRARVRACAPLDLYVLSSEFEDSMKAGIRFMRRFAFKGTTNL